MSIQNTANPTADQTRLRPPNGQKKHIVLLRKAIMLAVGLALLSYVLRNTDWQQVSTLARQANIGWMIASLAAVPVMVALCVWKWQGILAISGEQVSFAKLASIYVTGQFYNHLLPSSSGGDIVRMVLTRRETNNHAIAISSIIMERLTGLVVLMIMALTAIFFTPELRDDRILFLAVLSGNGMALAILILAFSNKVSEIFLQVFKNITWAAVVIRKINSIQNALWVFRNHKQQLVIALLQSAGFYIVAVFSVLFATRAFGVTPTLNSQFMIVPIVLTVTLLPITIGGLGLWEWSFTAAFTAFSMPPELGLSVSLLLRVRDVFWSVAGYAIVLIRFVSQDSHVKPKEVLQVLKNGSRESM